MPTHNPAAATTVTREIARMFDRLDADSKPATRADVQALAAEVAALREALAPSQSPIVHGADALREFAALRGRRVR